MRLCAALILLATLSTACGLRCFTCIAAEPQACTDTTSCGAMYDRCYSFKAEGLNVVTKGCQSSVLCVGSIDCCEGDLCNSAALTGPSIILLLVPCAIIKLLL